MNIHGLQDLYLVSSRLYMKPIQVGMADQIYEVIVESYELLAPWQIWVWGERENLTVHNYEEFIFKKIKLRKEGKDLTLLIFDTISHKLVGSVSINKIEGNQGFLGFWVKKSCIGKGYAKEAAQCLITFAFNNLQHSQVNAIHSVGNVQSQKVLLSLGFQLSKLQNSTYLDYYLTNSVTKRII